MRKKTIIAADLFCGAGGTSTGISQAADELDFDLNLLAVNHWPTAVNTHSLNHPGVRHLCEALENVAPAKVVPGGRLNLLAASPECTHHSIAAGGRPRNEQSRATAWHVCRWAADLTVENIMIENVREFQDWGPLTKTSKPMKRRKGETFKAFINALRSMGYSVEHRVVNAADYGDPTSRRRLIVLARRGKPVIWPEPTHGTAERPHRAAKEIIDWSIKGQSIFNRKRPLAANTLRRIAAGLRKFGGPSAEPFLVMLYGTGEVRDVNRPMPTVTADGQHIGVCEPFLVTMEHQGSVRAVDKPVPTITTAKGGAFAVVEPFMVPVNFGERKSQSPRTHDLSKPFPTVTGGNSHALIEPILLGQQSGHNGSPVSAPCPTVATAGAIALCEPFVVKYYGTAGANSLDEPLDTVTTKDRFMLVEPKTGAVIAELDILFRMLQPHELAAAMSFPKNYRFTGTKTDQVKQIGNAVPVNLARACARALLLSN